MKRNSGQVRRRAAPTESELAILARRAALAGAGVASLFQADHLSFTFTIFIIQKSASQVNIRQKYLVLAFAPEASEASDPQIFRFSIDFWGKL